VPDQSTSSLLAWIPPALAVLSGAWWGIRKGFNINQRLVLVETAVKEAADDREKLMHTYEEDRKKDAAARLKLERVDERTTLILEELRRR